MSAPSDPPPKQRLGGLATALLVVIGIALLLPGLCPPVIAGYLGMKGGASIGLWLVLAIVAAGGVLLIIFAVSRYQEEE